MAYDLMMVKKKIEIIKCMLSDHNETKLKINIAGNFPKTWRLNNILLNKRWVKEEISKKLKAFSTK